MANVRFAVGIQRLIPFLGYHHVLMILIAIAIILLCKSTTSTNILLQLHTNCGIALLLAGCSSSSPLIPSIFIINFYYQQYPPVFDPTQANIGYIAAIHSLVGDAQLEVRVGYFGICINPYGQGTSWLCGNNVTLLAQQIDMTEDPVNLIWVAETFKNSVVFPYLL